jgi:glycosyltransferase involved in cell wall biosynthesis
VRIVGNGPEREALIDTARVLGVPEMVSVEAAVPKSGVPALLSEADLLFSHLKALDVFRWGVSPNKIFDYQAAARPIVFATSATENPVSRSGAGLVIPPENPTLVADAIEQVACMSVEERRSMGLRARAFVEGAHEYGILARKLNAALGALVR